jgi:asparagine synthase (glutamine-hydrolysing)
VSAITGFVRRSGGAEPEVACRSMLAELVPYGRHSQDCRTLGEACFGRALDAVLPEDEFDRQPLIGGGGRYLLAADVRIDNRGEIGERLGIGGERLRQASDADLMLDAWEKWQLGGLDHLLGDIALAVWDSDQRLLTLARSPNSLKPLFFHRRADLLAFASLPAGILALPDVRRRLDMDKAAAIAAGLAEVDSNTFFIGIQSVRHGEAVELSAAGARVIKLWNLDAIAPSRLKTPELAEAMRAELERAVAAQLRRRSGIVACHLSAGRDSSAVATTAARAVRASGDPLIALTGAPHAGFAGLTLRNRIADESELAAVTARNYPEITHVVCRSRKKPIGPALRRLNERHHRPITNLSALHWAGEIDEEASRRGVSVMLIGWAGNFSISAGGPRHLIDVLNQQGVLGWAKHAARCGGLSWSRWREIARVSLAPFLPEQLFARVMRLSGRDVAARVDMPILRQPYRAQAATLLREEFGDPRPPSCYADFRRSFLLARENAEKMSLALYGLDVRDPTADRRLVELCLSFPPDRLVSRQGTPSPVYEAAFKDRIPAQVMQNRKRGHQGADWFELFDKAEVAAIMRRSSENRFVRELFDLDQIDRMIASWPDKGSTEGLTLLPHRNQLLGAVGVADFIELHFPD